MGIDITPGQIMRIAGMISQALLSGQPAEGTYNNRLLANSVMETGGSLAADEYRKKMLKQMKKQNKKAGLKKLGGEVGSTVGTVAGVLAAPFTGGTSLMIPVALGAGGAMAGGTLGELALSGEMPTWQEAGQWGLGGAIGGAGAGLGGVMQAGAAPSAVSPSALTAAEPGIAEVGKAASMTAAEQAGTTGVKATLKSALPHALEAGGLGRLSKTVTPGQQAPAPTPTKTPVADYMAEVSRAMQSISQPAAPAPTPAPTQTAPTAGPPPRNILEGKTPSAPGTQLQPTQPAPPAGQFLPPNTGEKIVQSMGFPITQNQLDMVGQWATADRAAAPTTYNARPDVAAALRQTPWYSHFTNKYGAPPPLNNADYNYNAAWDSGLRPSWNAEHAEFRWPDLTPGGQTLKAPGYDQAAKDALAAGTPVAPGMPPIPPGVSAYSQPMTPVASLAQAPEVRPDWQLGGQPGAAARANIPVSPANLGPGTRMPEGGHSVFYPPKPEAGQQPPTAQTPQQVTTPPAAVPSPPQAALPNVMTPTAAPPPAVPPEKLSVGQRVARYLVENRPTLENRALNIFQELSPPNEFMLPEGPNMPYVPEEARRGVREEITQQMELGARERARREQMGMERERLGMEKERMGMEQQRIGLEERRTTAAEQGQAQEWALGLGGLRMRQRELEQQGWDIMETRTGDRVIKELVNRNTGERKPLREEMLGLSPDVRAQMERDSQYHEERMAEMRLSSDRQTAEFALAKQAEARRLHESVVGAVENYRQWYVTTYQEPPSPAHLESYERKTRHDLQMVSVGDIYRDTKGWHLITSVSSDDPTVPSSTVSISDADAAGLALFNGLAQIPPPIPGKLDQAAAAAQATKPAPQPKTNAITPQEQVKQTNRAVQGVKGGVAAGLPKARAITREAEAMKGGPSKATEVAKALVTPSPLYLSPAEGARLDAADAQAAEIKRLIASGMTEKAAKAEAMAKYPIPISTNPLFP